MKIALFIAEFSGDGAERVFACLAKEFRNRGHAVDLIVGNIQNGAYLKDLPPSVCIIDLKVARMRESLPALKDYLRAHRPDVLMATLIHSCCFAVLAKILTGSKTKIVLREANTISADLEQYSWKKKISLGFAVRTLYPLSNAIIGISTGVVHDLKKLLPKSQDKVHLVYSPIITDDIFMKTTQHIDHPWFGDPSVPVVLSVGRLTKQKRFDVLIRAFARVRPKINARLLILGEGELRGELEALIAELGLKNDVHLFGFDPNPFKYMAAARLFVMSSDWEGLPGVLIQALACGCPVVSTDCPSGPRDILKGGQLGKLVPMGNDWAMAEAMEEALNKQPYLINHSELEQFRAHNATEHYLRVLDAVRNS